jgi:hypothetical protein
LINWYTRGKEVKRQERAFLGDLLVRALEMIKAGALTWPARKGVRVLMS